jgi:hypothetical protein
MLGLGPTYEDVEVRELSIVSFNHYAMPRANAVHTSVGCVTCNGTCRWAMFATVQFQAHRGEKARKNRVSEEKEEVEPGAQLQKRVIGNERRSYKAGSGSWR